MWHVFACFLRFRFIMYLVLALFKVALVNFTLNKYMMMMILNNSGIVEKGDFLWVLVVLCSKTLEVKTNTVIFFIQTTKQNDDFQ